MNPLCRRIERLESARPAPKKETAFDALVKSLSVTQIEEMLAEFYRQVPEEFIEQELAVNPHIRAEVMRARAAPSNPALVALLSSVWSASDTS